jgi:hypothetical protein
MHHLRFRQIHLDFHTSPQIPALGAAFDRRRWQATLKRGHVNSITLFSKCHHGWSYHPTTVGKMHPHLGFDLLRAQFDACQEIDVATPVYLSAGIDNLAAHEHPEWREVDCEGRYAGWAKAPIEAGFHKLCFNSPYLDYLCAQVSEAARLFPAAAGIFLDIISQGQCCCRWCLETMERQGLDATREEDRRHCAQLALRRYYQATTDAAKAGNPEMPVFHNSGHVAPGRRDLLPFFSHLELESLPTGGWGYDHYPMSAKYVKGLGLDFLGMTGKFHTTWGEFGGYKHPNALRYECAAMLAYGSKCSVGDQLHPDGSLDESTYALIGAAYAEVEKKEPWCDQVESVADIGLLASAALRPGHEGEAAADVGAARILLEGQFLFDVLDAEMEFSRYKLLVLPDDVPVTPELKAKLDAYLAQGGKLFLSGASGVKADGSGFLFDVGGELQGPSPFQPDYVLPVPELRADFVGSPLVMYLPSQRIRATAGESLGQVYDPYFNRSFRHFCSHQHAPPRPEPSGFDCGVRNGNLLYLAHPVFTLYRAYGAIACRQYVAKALRRLLGPAESLRCNLPSTGRVTLMEQPHAQRYVLHLLHATACNRGGAVELAGGDLIRESKSVEVIEELLPLAGVEVALRPPKPVTAVRLVPEGRPLPFSREADGGIRFKLESLLCHQMVELAYG